MTTEIIKTPRRSASKFNQLLDKQYAHVSSKYASKEEAVRELESRGYEYKKGHLWKGHKGKAFLHEVRDTSKYLRTFNDDNSFTDTPFEKRTVFWMVSWGEPNFHPSRDLQNLTVVNSNGGLR